jgi:DNA-binding winged helix-turn-helix (wHTH) protein
MAATAPVTRTLRFDVFELNARAGELRKRGVKLHLRGQPLQVLAILVERAGDVVTREELQSQIWPADTFVDFDHSIHNAVARIREVLGDSVEKPRYIETLPRRGYRYIGPVEDSQTLRLGTETGDHTSQPVTLVTPPKRKTNLVLVLGALFWRVFVLRGPDSSQRPRISRRVTSVGRHYLHHLSFGHSLR